MIPTQYTIDASVSYKFDKWSLRAQVLNARGRFGPFGGRLPYLALAPQVVVVTPLECQSKPSTQPRAWNQNGSDSRSSTSISVSFGGGTGAGRRHPAR